MEAAKALLVGLGYPEVRPFCNRDFGREEFGGCVSVVVPHKSGYELLTQLRAQLPEGLVAYVGTTRWLNKKNGLLGRLLGQSDVEVVVGPGTSQWDILRHAQADAVNYDLDTEALIARLTTLDQEFPLDIMHAQTDTIGFDLRHPCTNPERLAEELYSLCPDIVDQGFETMDRLRVSLIQSRRVTLWWD